MAISHVIPAGAGTILICTGFEIGLARRNDLTIRYHSLAGITRAASGLAAFSGYMCERYHAQLIGVIDNL